MTSSNSQMHNGIMEDGSKERPPMIAPSSYAQWKSRFMRYLILKPNKELLKKCIDEGPYELTQIITLVVQADGDNPGQTRIVQEETYTNTSLEKRALIDVDAEAEAIHMNLNGIGNDIYSMMDAYPNPKEIRLAIEPLQQGEFYRMMNEMVKNKLKVDTMQVNVQFLQQLQPEWSRFVAIVKNKGKEIVKASSPPHEFESEEDSDEERAQRDNNVINDVYADYGLGANKDEDGDLLVMLAWIQGISPSPTPSRKTTRAREALGSLQDGMWSSSKRSTDNEGCQYHSNSCLSEIELYPSSYKVDQGILKDTYSLSNFILVEDDEHEFIPRVVHLELIEGASDDGHEDCKNVIPSFLHVKLIEGGIASDDEYEDSQGYNGYDEDNDDDGDEDDVDSVTGNFNDKDDLTFRIEEFIAKNNNLWKEERFNDKLLYLEY
ncbi:hypothetical protein Tco_1234895 [Tanacetum coccineum]